MAGEDWAVVLGSALPGETPSVAQAHSMLLMF